MLFGCCGDHKMVCLYEEVSQLLLLVVNTSMKNTLALSTNAAPGIEGRTDVGDKCQLHLITPALCYIVHLYNRTSQL